MIDLPSAELVVWVFSIVVNRLPSDPPDELCKLLLCRKLLNASTKNCVAETTVGKLIWLAAAAFNILVSNINDDESNCPKPEISTVSTLFAAVVADELSRKVTGWTLAVPKKSVCTIEEEMIGEMSMIVSRDGRRFVTHQPFRTSLAELTASTALDDCSVQIKPIAVCALDNIIKELVHVGRTRKQTG